MSNIATITPSAADARQVALIRKTVAADCNNDEFDLFIWTARHLRLDPLRRQIYAFVYSKNDPDKRKMTIVTAIDGFRTIAERTGNYRPDEDEPTFEFDPALKGPANPEGIVKATVRVYKFSHGAWHKVTASAYWSEFAPLKDSCDEGFDWVDTGETWPDTGKPKRKKVPRGLVAKTLDTSGNWGKMPRLMLAKVAEALALRKAWPDDFSNVYAAEEVDRMAALDVSASELAEQGAMAERADRAGIKSGTILLDWLDSGPIAPVPVGQVADRVMQFIDANREEPSMIATFKARNVHAMREFWAAAPTDALEVKKALEKALMELTP